MPDSFESVGPEPVVNEKPDLEAEWHTWKKNPTPQANAHMLTMLNPIIDKAAKANATVNPLIKARARTIALQSLQSYDPTRGRLQSHIYNHMQGLKRYAGQMSQGISVPERVILDRRTLDAAHTNLTDELGREPNDDEIASRTGFAPARLAKIRRYNSAMSEGFFGSLGEGGEPYDPAVNNGMGVGSKAWLQVIYDELAPADKKVFEWTLGHNGHPTLQNQEIAKRLRRSPGWVSQRKMAIQAALDREQDLSPFGGAV